MKTFKKVILGILAAFVLAALGGYLYFNQKFTPEKNYLSVKNESGKVGIFWENKNRDAMLIPIHFGKDSTTYFLQMDTGSPYTIFYKNSIQNLSQIKQGNKRSVAGFKIGNSEIFSDKFKIINYGEKDSKIIGTLGTDILENRKTVFSFKGNFIELNLNNTPQKFAKNRFGVLFPKRKIIIPGNLAGEKSKFLYDSGTSAFELMTSKESWEKLRDKRAKVKTEMSNSWGNTLTNITTKSNSFVVLGNSQLPLNEVTYTEGYSKMQYFLIKFSGMSGGMLGNKIFEGKEIFFDFEKMKMAVD